jgi:hypothetical protein
LALDQYWLHELMACTLELKRRAKGNQGIRWQLGNRLLLFSPHLKMLVYQNEDRGHCIGEISNYISHEVWILNSVVAWGVGNFASYAHGESLRK